MKKLIQKIVVHIFKLRLAPFASKLVQLFVAQWAFEECLNISKENVANFEFLRIFKGLLHLDTILTNLDANGVKRSLKVWAVNFYKSFFKNTLLFTKCGPSKTWSVHTYVMHRMVYFERYCTWYFFKNNFHVFSALVLKGKFDN